MSGRKRTAYELGAEHERRKILRLLGRRFDGLEAEMERMEAVPSRHGGQRRQEVATKSRVQEGIALAIWEITNMSPVEPVQHWMNEGEVSPVSACGIVAPRRVAVDFGAVTCEGCRIWLEQCGGVASNAWED